MPEPVQPTAAEKAAADTAARARALVDALWNDPEIGDATRKKAKALFPDISLPEDAPAVTSLKAQNEKLAADFKALSESIAADKKAAAETAQTQSLEQALESARKKFSLTDEGFQKMVDRMKEKANYTDAESAAAWVASQTPPPKPSGGPSWAPQALNAFGDTSLETLQTLHNNTDKFFDDTVSEILRENQAA